jgi:hypothetical protein
MAGWRAGFGSGGYEDLSCMACYDMVKPDYSFIHHVSWMMGSDIIGPHLIA